MENEIVEVQGENVEIKEEQKPVKFIDRFELKSIFRVEGETGIVLYKNNGKKFITAKFKSKNLPNLNKTFMFEGHEYKITHVNEDKNRFSFSEL